MGSISDAIIAGMQAWRGESGQPAEESAGPDPVPHGEAGYANMDSGAGDSSYDPEENYTYNGERVVWEREAHLLLTGSSLAARCITTPIRDYTAPGFALDDGVDGPDADEILQRLIGDIRWHAQGRSGKGAQEAMRIALTLAQAYGGALLVAFHDDSAEEMCEPWDGTGQVQSFGVYQRWEVQIQEVSQDRESPWYLQPVEYLVTPRSPGRTFEEPFTVHASRCFASYGPYFDAQTGSENDTWGDSAFRKLRRPLRRVEVASKALSYLVTRQGMPLVGMMGMASITSRDGAKNMLRRLQLVLRQASQYRAWVHDSEKESVGFINANISGVEKVFDRAAQNLAAAANIPMTRLFGISPAGLNATGESDRRSYYDRLEADRAADYKPMLEQVVRWVLPALQSEPGLEMGANWALTFPEFGAPTQGERLEGEKRLAEVFATYVSAGMSQEQAQSILESSELVDRAEIPEEDAPEGVDLDLTNP